MATTIGSTKEILDNADYNAVSVTVSATDGGTVDKAGHKVVPAGTFLVGKAGSIFKDRNQSAVPVTDVVASGIDGVLLNDVDVSDGDAPGALVHRGTVRSDKTVGYTDAVDAKLPRIQFVAGA